MSGMIRKSPSTSQMPQTPHNEAPLDFDAPINPWHRYARATGRATLRVVAASTAHFAVGFVAGQGALVTYGKATGSHVEAPHMHNAGLLAGCAAAVYGAIQGLGWTQGTVQLADIGASLLGVASAGLAFPLGGVLGGHAAAWTTHTLDVDQAKALEAQAGDIRESFNRGSERGALLLAMASYGACRWALKKRSPKRQEDLLPTTAFVKTQSVPQQSATWRRRIT